MAIKAITLQDILVAVFLLSHQDVVREAMGVSHAVVEARATGTGMGATGMGMGGTGMDMVMDVGKDRGTDMDMDMDMGTAMVTGTVMDTDTDTDMDTDMVMAGYALFLHVNRHQCI